MSLAILLAFYLSSDGGLAYILQAYALATAGSFENEPHARTRVIVIEMDPQRDFHAGEIFSITDKVL